MGTDYDKSFFSGKKLLITGVCGTVGSALLDHLTQTDASEIQGIDHNESQLFHLSQDIADHRIRLLLGDIRDRDQLTERFENVDIVIHTAAYKHVGTCEGSPRDAVNTNVIGTQNVIDAARSAGVRKVVFTSSDKAVNPTSVMGTSKLLGERLITAAASNGSGSGPVFAATRFGNVLGSSGSVVPVFAAQIAAGKPVTLTERSMNRFVMTQNEAVGLVLDSVTKARGGEIFVTKMHAIRIRDLADSMISILAPRFRHDPERIVIKEIGARAGEKLYEELINSEEACRVIETESFFIILPALSPRLAETLTAHYEKSGYVADDQLYRSDQVTPMTDPDLSEYLVRENVV